MTTSAVATRRFEDLGAVARTRIQRHAAFVAAPLHETGTIAAFGNRSRPAVFAAIDLFDADHVGTEIGEQRRAERAGNVAAEIENANAFEHGCHVELHRANDRRIMPDRSRGRRDSRVWRCDVAAQRSWRRPRSLRG